MVDVQKNGLCKQFMDHLANPLQQKDKHESFQNLWKPSPSEVEHQGLAEDDYDFGDSLCTTGVLDSLEKIESWNTHTSPLASPLSKITTHSEHSKITTQQHRAGVSRDQLSKSNSSGLRRSPRIRLQQLNRQKNVQIGETMEGTYHEVSKNKKVLKDALLTSEGNETMENVGTRELTENVFLELQVSVPKMEGSINQLQIELQNVTQNQESPQNLVRSDRQNPKDSENQCAKDFIGSSSIKKGATRNSSLKTLVTAAKCESEPDSNVCEKKASSNKRESCKEVECGGKMLKDIRKRCIESLRNEDHSNEENGTQETKVPTNKCLKYLSKTTRNRRHNKENVQSFKDSIGKNIFVSKRSDNNLEDDESFRASLETRRKNGRITPSAGVSNQQCNIEADSTTNSCLNFSISVNEEVKNPKDNIPENFYSPENTIEKTRSIVLKSPINCNDSQSFLTTQEKMELSAWGLPDAVLKCYLENGVKKMFPWQAECLSLPGVLEGRNLVYSAPTSAGKTLVAELLLLKRVMEGGRKGIFILPFVSVAREKMHYLQRMFGSVGVRVEGFMGSQGPPGGLKSTDIAVCTIEKANNLINRLLEDCRVRELGMVVVDELHMLGDSHRGYLLELLLAKLTYVTSSGPPNDSQDSPEGKMRNNGIQVIGMSATLPNLELLAGWLDAALYTTDFRPVPLRECVKLGTSVYDSTFSKLRDLSPQLTLKGDRDHLMQLCLETVLEGYSVLVFCPSKAWCENLADSIAKEFYKIGKTNGSYSPELGSKLRSALDPIGIRSVLDALRKCPVKLDNIMARSVAFGAAYHHAGLTFDERDIIEGGFRTGALRVLMATSTLSSGVNLPARRVIIRSPLFGGSILDALTYKQMVGRAGRKGVDVEGESILICREGEKEKALTLLSSNLPPITSCLQKHASLTSSMKRAILEVIVSGVAKSPQQVENYCSHTLLAAALRAEGKEATQPVTAHNSLTSCVNFLLENEFIRLQSEEGNTQYVGTQLGLAVLASGLSPDEGLHVFSELHRARKCFVLENELHIVYQVTPVYVSAAWPELDWMSFLRVWEALSEDHTRVAQLVGVEESFIVRAMRGAINKRVQRQAQQLAVHQRFYAAMALQDLVQEVPLDEVACKFGASRGVLQTLQQSAATFAGMVTVFCNRLGWHNLELLVAQFRERLHFGIQRDLCDLVRLAPLLNAQRARHLHSAGLETVAMVAGATPAQVEEVLHSATPFHSTKFGEEATQGMIWLSTGRFLTEAEAAVLIVLEARQLVQKELGISSINWNQKVQGVTNPGMTHHTPRLCHPATGVVRKISISPLGVMDTPTTGESLLKRQQIPSLSTSIHRKSVEHPLQSGNRKGCRKKAGKKARKSSSCKDFCSQESKSEEKPLLRLGSVPLVVKQAEEIPSKNNRMMNGHSEHFNTREYYKSQDSQKCKRITNKNESKTNDTMVVNNSNIDLLSKSIAKNDKGTEVLSEMMKETACTTEASHIDKSNYCSTMANQERKRTRYMTDSAHILFCNIRTPKEREKLNKESGNAFIPESQEDKSDNMFSHNHRKKRCKSTSAPSIKDRKMDGWTEDKTNGSLVSDSSDIKVMASHSLGDICANKPACGGAVATVETGVDADQDGNISLPYTPIRNELMKRIASSTPITVLEAQSSKSPALLLTPGSDVATSVFNLMINSGLNDSSDLFSETDMKEIQGNPKESKEFSNNSEDMQTKDTERHSYEVSIFNQKRQSCRREYQEVTMSSNKLNSNTMLQSNEIDNSKISGNTNSNDICIPDCQRLKNQTNIEKDDNHEVKTYEVTCSSDALYKKNDCFIKINALECNESFQKTTKEDYFILTDSQKNGLMMTMNSQDSCCSLRSPDCQRKFDIKLNESGDSDCNKSSLDTHKKLDDKPNRKDDIIENHDGDGLLQARKKRKLQMDTDIHVLTKRMCAMHEKSCNQLNCETKDMKESTSHVTFKMDYMGRPIRKTQETNEDLRNLAYFETITDLSDLGENRFDVEEKEPADSKLSEITDKEDIFNQAVQDVSKLGNQSTSSLLSLGREGSLLRRIRYEAINEGVSEYKKSEIGTPKDFSVSDSFLEQAFESWPQAHASVELSGYSGHLSQEDLRLQNTMQQPSLNQDSQPLCEPSLLVFQNDTKNHEKETEKRVRDVQQPQNTRDLPNCTITACISHDRKKAAVKPGMSSGATSNTSYNDDIFSQLEITPRTEALLEGELIKNNNCQERLSKKLICSPTERPEKKPEYLENKIMKSENTGKSKDKMSNENIMSQSEGVIMPVAITNNEADKEGNNKSRYKASKNHIIDNLKNTEPRPVAHDKSGHSTSQVQTKELRNRQEHDDANSTNHLSSIMNNSLPSTSSFCIIDVVNDSQVFASFVEELKQQTVVSIALACERSPSQKEEQEQGIGWRITSKSRTPRRKVQSRTRQQVAGVLVENSDLMVVGLAVCWGYHDAYYLNLRTCQDEPTSCSMPTPALSDGVHLEERLETIKKFFSKENQCVVRVWDAKRSVRLLAASGLGCLTGPVEDPRVAAWMLDPGAKEPNICNLVMNHNLHSLPLLEGVSGCRGLGGLGTTTSNPGSSRVRAAVESVVVFHLIPALFSQLKEVEMVKSFVEVEMRSVVELAYMELNGLGFSNKECEAQKHIMQAKLSSLKREAHLLAGHPVNLSSPVEISKVLYGELHLSHPTSLGSCVAPNTRRHGRGRGAGPTNKEALEKLKPHHSLPGVILQWRQINSALTRVVFPLQQVKVHYSQLAMDRIHPITYTFTSTGRITMHEPSLQTIPRDFDIQVTEEETSRNTKKKGVPQYPVVYSDTMTQLAPLLAPVPEEQQHKVSLRHAFIARPGHVLLTADYSQIELRLLAHLAGDQPLLKLLNRGEDVFTLLAIQLLPSQTHPSEVSPEQRHQAKQVCYGMIYGMGAHALGEQLGVGEEEARILLDQFQGSFPGLRRFAEATVKTVRRTNYVTTLLGRRRYLPAISSQCPQARAQSERQAVNTAVQGSAADLVKLAMVNIQQALRETFPTTPAYLTAPTSSPRCKESRGAYLVLHLHDELMYEVMSEDVIQVAQIVKKHMEGVLKLSVDLPVKVKVGSTWGSMQTLNL